MYIEELSYPLFSYWFRSVVVLDADPKTSRLGKVVLLEENAVVMVANLDPPRDFIRFGSVDFLNRSILEETRLSAEPSFPPPFVCAPDSDAVSSWSLL